MIDKPEKCHLWGFILKVKFMISKARVLFNLVGLTLFQDISYEHKIQCNAVKFTKNKKKQEKCRMRITETERNQVL